MSEEWSKQVAGFLAPVLCHAEDGFGTPLLSLAFAVCVEERLLVDLKSMKG